MYTLMKRQEDKSEEFISLLSYEKRIDAELAMARYITQDDWDIEVTMDIADQERAIQRRYKVVEI